MAKRTISPFRKIWTIITSRFKREKEEEWVLRRREVCLGCEYNSLHRDTFTLKQRVSKVLSDFYTAITFAEYIDLGTCTCCGCPLFFKTREPSEDCGAKEEYGDDKWVSIMPPRNSKKKARNG